MTIHKFKKLHLPLSAQRKSVNEKYRQFKSISALGHCGLVQLKSKFKSKDKTSNKKSQPGTSLEVPKRPDINVEVERIVHKNPKIEIKEEISKIVLNEDEQKESNRRPIVNNEVVRRILSENVHASRNMAEEEAKSNASTVVADDNREIVIHDLDRISTDEENA